MGMTISEKILAKNSGLPTVSAGDVVTVEIDTCVVLDPVFRITGPWQWPTAVWDAEKVVIITDHMVMSAHAGGARALQLAREVAEHYDIRRVHFAGADQGISHQIVADRAYALPGTILVNSDSHTLSGGALNCLARGFGITEIMYVLCTGRTWYRAEPTIRYDLHGHLAPGVTAKDVFLHLAGKWGAHTNHTIEFGGPAQSELSLDARRTLSTMCAEVSADLALWDPDDVLIDFIRSMTDRPFDPMWPDADANYADVRRIDLSTVEPFVSGIDSVVHNTQPLSTFDRKVRLDQCVVGSCANGTLDDLEVVAQVVAGRKVAPGLRFIVTPGSSEIYRAAASSGILATIAESGAIVTPSACGACAGQDFGTLAPGEVCLTATTRNYKGRMGSPDAEIYIAAPATVAASAITGYITNPTDLVDD